MAEPDLSGMGFPSSEGSGAGGVAGVFRANSKISLDYKDITGLVKEMNTLADAVIKVKKAIDSLDENKTRQALSNLGGAVGRGGGSSGGGGNTTANGGGHTFGGVSPGMQMMAVGLGAASMLAGAYAGRKQDDLMSDVTSMRVSLASGVPGFGLSQANSYVRNTLGPVSFSRSDMNQAAQSLAGQYGTINSSSSRTAFRTAAAFGSLSMQGATFGADLENAANSPTSLNTIRRFTGKNWAQIPSLSQYAGTVIKASFGSSNPTAQQLDSMRPGSPQYANMMALTGGNAALTSVVSDYGRARQKWISEGNSASSWNDQTITKMSSSTQKKLFGDKSLFIASRNYEAGKAVKGEAGLNLARSGLVGSEEFLLGIQNNTKEVSEKLTQYLAPLGDKIGGMSAALSQLGQIMTPLAILGKGGGISGMLGTIGIGKGAAAAAEDSGLLGSLAQRIGPGLGALGAGALGDMAGSLVGDQLNRLTGRKQGQKGGVNWGNILARTTGGAAAGGVFGGGVFSIPGAAIGGGIGLASGLAHEIFHIGDPVWPGGQDLSGDQSHGSSDSKMSLTDATNLLLSRNQSSEGTSAVNNMQPDLRMKLGKLFSSNKALVLNSGWRSKASQQKLYDLYKAGKGNMAAKPGTSNHEKGLAADIGPNSQYGWLSKAGKADGLVRPMSSEPWHWEPPGASSRGGGVSADGADPGSGVGRSIMASVRQAFGGGALQWVDDDSAPALSGIAISSSGSGVSSGSAPGSGGTGGVVTGSGQALSINAVAKLASKAGVPSSQLQTAVAIAMTESGLVPGKHNRTSATGDDSYGLWQINMTDAAGGPNRRKKYHLSNDSQLLTPSKNAEAMSGESNHGSNWGAWTGSYDNGKYKQYMSQVGHALATGVGDPVVGPATPASFGGSSTHGVSVRGGNRATVNVYVTMRSASDSEMMRVAKIVQEQIEGPMADVQGARNGG